jgi:hypothetical protein
MTVTELEVIDAESVPSLIVAVTVKSPPAVPGFSVAVYTPPLPSVKLLILASAKLAVAVTVIPARLRPSESTAVTVTSAVSSPPALISVTLIVIVLSVLGGPK